MVAPVRTAASWLAGRLFLLLVILAALVAHALWGGKAETQLRQWQASLSGAELIRQLEDGRDAVVSDSHDVIDASAHAIDAAASYSRQQLNVRIVALNESIATREKARRSDAQRMLALLTGRGFQDDLNNEVAIEVMRTEREALVELRDKVAPGRVSVAGAELRYRRASERIRAIAPRCKRLVDTLADFTRQNRLQVWNPFSPAWSRAIELRRQRDAALRHCKVATGEYWNAKRAVENARTRLELTANSVRAAASGALQPLNEFIAARQDALRETRQTWSDIKREAGRKILLALLIVVAVTLTPVLIRAFLYYMVAPAAARRPPIRLYAKPASREVAGASGSSSATRRSGEPRISAVSQDLSVDIGEEMLVQPDFLQSSSDRARTDTRWLLDWRYPLTSIAAGMVALTRIRVSSPQSFVISSKTDPLSEVGVIQLEAGSAFTLQPRNLVGLVQPIDSPIRIESRWQLARLSAWITFQFRYLVFHGPGTLIVQGCRGVRVEEANVSRSIDQASTIGFSANLDYNCRRTETFGAYLLGMRSLFNDNFRGAPGVYAYEEMPYLYKKTGITGRGLEGLIDGVMKAFGI